METTVIIYTVGIMLDVSQNSAPRSKMPTPAITVEKNQIYSMLHARKKYNEIRRPLPLSEKIHPHSILQLPPTKLAKMSIDPKFVELTADAVRIIL